MATRKNFTQKPSLKCGQIINYVELGINERHHLFDHLGFFGESYSDVVQYQICHRGRGEGGLVIEKQTEISSYEYAKCFSGLLKQMRDESNTVEEQQTNKIHILKSTHSMEEKMKMKTILINIWKCLFLVLVLGFILLIIKRLYLLTYCS